MNKPTNRKPRSKGRGRRPDKDDSKYESTKDVGTKAVAGELPKGDRDNDPNWYFTDTRLAEQAAQLSFQQMLGDGPYYGNATVPTIMAIAMNASAGVSYTSMQGPVNWIRDGLNMMSAKLYTLLSTYSGRTSSYAPQDVGTMILAQGSMVEAIEHLRRAFGIALTYNFRNRSVPKLLIRAMGFNPDDLFAHMSDYRMRLNTYITMLNQVPLLDNIGFIRKCRDIYQKVYTDSESDMSQIYLYRPASFWLIDETTYSGGTILTTLDITNANGTHKVWDIDDYLDQVIDPMVNALLYSSTLNVIYADLINLANKAKVQVFALDVLSEDYIVIPEYNRNALLQIHNLNILDKPNASAFTASSTPGVYLTPNNDVYPDASINGLIYNPGWSNNPFGWIGADKAIIDMDTANPDLVDRIEALRFTASRALGTVNIGTTPYYCFFGLPDHYVADIYIFADGASPLVTFGGSSMVAGSSNSELRLALLEMFDWHPNLFVLNSASTVVAIASDLNYFTIVDAEYLVRLNRLMFTGLFDFRI